MSVVKRRSMLLCSILSDKNEGIISINFYFKVSRHFASSVNIIRNLNTISDVSFFMNSYRYMDDFQPKEFRNPINFY